MGVSLNSINGVDRLDLLGKISALQRAASFEPCGAIKEEIVNKKIFFLTC